MEGQSVLFSCSVSGLYVRGDHVGKQDLQGHAMTAALVGKEELAITLKALVSVGHMVIIVVAMEGQVKLVEAEAAPIFGVSLGLFKSEAKRS